MTKSTLNIFLAALVFLALTILSLYVAINYCGVMIALAANQNEGAFRQILINYGLGINGLGLLCFLFWYFFGPKLHRMDSLRFNMRIVWSIILLSLFIIALFISATMKSLIDWDATYSRYSYLLMFIYPLSSTVSFGIASAFFSPSILKYVPLMSKQTRKIYS